MGVWPVLRLWFQMRITWGTLPQKKFVAEGMSYSFRAYSQCDSCSLFRRRVTRQDFKPWTWLVRLAFICLQCCVPSQTLMSFKSLYLISQQIFNLRNWVCHIFTLKGSDQWWSRDIVCSVMPSSSTCNVSRECNHLQGKLVDEIWKQQKIKE